jgi:tetratricopeptide (TPR) repeat protein
VSPDEISEVMGRGPESPGRLWWTGEHERAVRAAERDLAVAASFSNFPMRIAALCRLGQAHHALGDYGRGIEFLAQATTLIPDDLRHEHFGMAAPPSVWARSWLASCHAERGDFDAAATTAAEAVTIAEDAKQVYAQVQAAFGLGTVHVVQRRADLAIPVLERALVTARLESISFLVPFLTGLLGAAYTLDGRLEAALALLRQTVEQAVEVGLVANHALRLVWLGHAQLRNRQLDAAMESARRALGLADEHHERGHHAYAQRLIGDVLAEAGAEELETARMAYQDARRAAEALGMRPLATECGLSLGRLGATPSSGVR